MVTASELTVFCGSSISIAEARRHFAGAFFPGPVKRGDLEKLETPMAIVVDGLFFQELSVANHEIMTALRQGKRLWGCSSMGALRAAECRYQGMTGVGRIYSGFASGELTADDDVALVMTPETFVPLSDTTADIDFFLRDKVDKSLGEKLLEVARSLYFARRRFSTVLDRAAQAKWVTASEAEHLGNLFAAAPKQKYLDALECFAEVKRSLERPL